MGGSTGRVALGVATGGLSEIPRMMDGGKKKSAPASRLSTPAQQAGLPVLTQKTKQTLLTGSGNPLGTGTTLLK